MARPSPLMLAASAPFVVACQYEYLPKIPAKNGSGDVEVRLDRIRLDVHAIRNGSWLGKTSYSAAVSAPPATTLVAVSTTTAGTRTCRRGTDASSVRIDGNRVSLSAPVAIEGPHRLDLQFPHPMANLDEDPVLDFEFGTADGELCERVDVLGPPDPGWETASRNDAFGLENRVVVPIHPVGHVSVVLPFQVGFRHRFGKTELSIDPGLAAIAGCESGVCRPGQRGTEPGFGIPFGIGATFLPESSERFGVGLRLDEYALWIPLRSGTQFTLVHAPAGVLRYSVIPAGARSYPDLPRVFSLDIEAPIGVMAAREETGIRVAPYLGLGVSILFWH